MKICRYFIFSLLCLFSCSNVFAQDEIIIKSITPVYDKESSIILSNEGDVPNIIFNDKNQLVKYNVVIENTANYDVKINSVELTKITENFVKSNLEGINKDDVLKRNATKEIVLSLETVQMKGWGRNFNDELVTTINFEKIATNPETNTNTLMFLLIITAYIYVSMCIVYKKNSKIVGCVLLILAFGTTLNITKAEDILVLKLKTNIEYKSQNVMKETGCVYEYDKDEDDDILRCEDYWNYHYKI